MKFAQRNKPKGANLFFPVWSADRMGELSRHKELAGEIVSLRGAAAALSR